MKHFTSFKNIKSLKSGIYFTFREHIQMFNSHAWPGATRLDSVDQEGCLLFRELGPYQLIY